MHANNWLQTSLDWCCRPHNLPKRRRGVTRSTYPPTKASIAMTIRFHQDMTLLYSNLFQFWRNLIWNLPPHPANTSKHLSFGTVSLGLLSCRRFCSSVWQADLAFPFPFPLPYMGEIMHVSMLRLYFTFGMIEEKTLSKSAGQKW